MVLLWLHIALFCCTAHWRCNARWRNPGWNHLRLLLTVDAFLGGERAEILIRCPCGNFWILVDLHWFSDGQILDVPHRAAFDLDIWWRLIMCLEELVNRGIIIVLYIACGKARAQDYFHVFLLGIRETLGKPAWFADKYLLIIDQRPGRIADINSIFFFNGPKRLRNSYILIKHSYRIQINRVITRRPNIPRHASPVIDWTPEKALVAYFILV